jgi:hypothetical protein
MAISFTVVIVASKHFGETRRLVAASLAQVSEEPSASRSQNDAHVALGVGMVHYFGPY